MENIPDIHLCIQQPPGYVHSLGLLDQARYFRYQFRRLGVNVSISKNRLRHDAVNLIFGAHLGFDPAQRERHACIFVNLEQLGDGGAAVSPDYLRLLATSAATDYDAHNVAAYATCADDVPVVPLLHAPYLKPEQSVPLNERPIDLLFIGSMNPRRRAWVDRIEACGLSVTLFDGPLYGPERDQFIVQAKAVINAHFYESSRFEQARVSHCLSLGTPVIAERTAKTRPHPAFDDCVLWVEDEGLEQFFTKDFGTPAFYEVTREALLRFEQADPIDAYAELLAFATGFVRAHHERRPAQPWQPQCINLGSGKDYKPGWLNIDLLDRTEPDLLLDLALPLALPFSRVSPRIGPIVLAEQSIDIIHANNVLEHVPDLVSLMGNCLRLLKTGGELQIEVPFERAPTAWQDPTHVRAMNEKSWIYYTDWFWYLGWFEHRFEMTRFVYLDSSLKECALKQAAFMRVVLRKTETTPRERNTARAMQADFGGIEADDCWPDETPSKESTVNSATPCEGPAPRIDIASEHTMPECSICRHDVRNWKPHPHIDQVSEFIKLTEVIGSDLTVYQCPACGCTDRDRHLWLYLNAIGLPAQLRGARLLHLAPERHLEALFEACGPTEYIKGDLFPSRPNQVKVNAEQLQFADGQFDLIVCNHVLEHVDSPHKALAEFHRCLKPKGLLIAQTPYSPVLKKTFELRVWPGKEFATLFYGQDDHVRLFADDIVDLFRAAGFQGDLMDHATLLPGIDPMEAGINVREPLFIFTRP